MMKILLILLILLFPLCAGASTQTAASCSVADISTAITAAGVGGTVNVPAGSCTWSTTLTVTRGITLKGAGAGSTIVTSNLTASDDLIIYQQSTPSVDETFIVTGFTFDLAGKSGGIWINNTDVTNAYEWKKIRIHHNSFLNGIGITTFSVNGQVYGVVDNNTFTSASGILDYIGGDFGAWNNLQANFGSVDALYFEDNTFTVKTAVMGSARGAKWVFRYNTFTFPSDSSSINGMLDLHGNQPGGGGTTAAMLGEIYGNYVIDNSGVSRFSDYYDQRGGKMLAFFNYATTNRADYTSGQVRNEYNEATAPVTNPAPNLQPQHVSSTYIWSMYNAGGLLPVTVGSDVSPPEVVENAQWWQDHALEAGAQAHGVGCGTTLPTNCTTGVGYFVTSQSCSTMTGLVGAYTFGRSHIQGTLYKCTATNTWTAYYTPYTYPHPLRGEGIVSIGNLTNTDSSFILK
jgi:hypothetical protein